MPAVQSSFPLEPFALPSLDDTFGAVLVGTFVGLVQYGCIIHQCFDYFRTYTKERWPLKILVVSVLLIETLLSILTMHICYYYLVTNFINPIGLTVSTWSVNLLGASAGTTVFLSQLFFLHRVYMFGHKHRAIAILSGVFLLAELAFSFMATFVPFLHGGNLEDAGFTWANSAGVGAAATADTLLTATLVISLHRSRTGVQHSDSILDILILYSINTGLLTGIFNIVSFIFALVRPGNLFYVAIDIVTTKLYAISLLAALNSRESLGRRARGVVLSTSIAMNTSRSRHSMGGDEMMGPVHRVEVRVTKESVSDREGTPGGGSKDSDVPAMVNACSIRREGLC